MAAISARLKKQGGIKVKKMGETIYRIPYDESCQQLAIADRYVKAVLEPQKAPASSRGQAEIVRQALARPVAGPQLGKLAAKAARILIITSDHTRPLPSKITLPLLLDEIRSTNPQAEIKILIATGYHRQMTRAEQLEKFGRQVVENEQLLVHDSRAAADQVYKGILPSGAELWLNHLVDWADLLLAEGFIEPHFFAGFSGGGKSVLPGIAAAPTVLANHCAEFIAHPLARSGSLAGNPLQEDILFAARQVGLAFILNVALDSKKNIIAAFAGQPEPTHAAGAGFVGHLATVDRVEADIVITSNGGYPLDQNIYQAVKGMTAAEACVRPGSVIIMVAGCRDGHGGEAFYRWLAEAASPEEVTEKILAVDRKKTMPDQWEAQVLARVLSHSQVILVSDLCDHELIRRMHMTPARDLEQALHLARARQGREAELVLIPDGVAVIVKK